MSNPMTILFFDFETTGIPNWNTPSGGDDQPHAVQLAAKLVDFSTRKVISQVNLIAKPDCWSISPELTEIHGISDEFARRVGVPERILFETLFNMNRAATLRVAHSEPFDARIQRIGMKRFMNDETLIEEWKESGRFCTMRSSREAVGAVNTNGKLKNPTLGEAYLHFTGNPMIGAHNAWADTEACETIYFAMRDAEIAA